MKPTLETAPAPTVHQAIATRKSVRAFLPDPVDPGLVRKILGEATRAASGGNLQPWRLYVLAGEERDALVKAVAEKQKQTPFGDGPEYAIYPPELTEPYVERRSRVAHMMYERVGIARDDRIARAKQMLRNFEFFGAPVGMVLTIDRQMGPPQFCDLGLFLGNVMLLAREHGLHTCAQEAWSLWGKTIREVVGVPEQELVFCGLCLGYADDQDPINALQTERAGLESFATFRGI